MADPDALLALRQSISLRASITFLTATKQKTKSLSEAAEIVLPQSPSGENVLTLPKGTPTRLRKPGRTQVDWKANPSDFYSLDAVYMAWVLREAATAEYMKMVKEAGVGFSAMVAVTEKQGVVEWLEGSSTEPSNIVPLEGESASNVDNQQKRKYVPDLKDIEAVKKMKLSEVELRDRSSILRGSKQSNFSSVRGLISERMQKLRDIQAAAAAPPSTSPSKPDRKSSSRGPRKESPIIMISSSPTALITLWNVRKFLEDSQFEDPTVAKNRAAEENTLRDDIAIVYRRRTHIEAGGRETETKVKYFVVDGIEALNKFGADPWERVVCVLTTGQAWQFKPYKWSEPRELFHRVKGFYVSWTNDAVNPKVKDWNVTELKIDPNKRHLDKSTVAQFWMTLDAWVGTSKPGLAT